MRTLAVAVLVMLMLSMFTVLSISGARAEPPTARLDVSPGSPEVGEEVTFSGWRSDAGSGDKMWYRFTTDDGGDSGWTSTGVWTHVFDDEGRYLCNLTVRNENGQETSINTYVSVGLKDDENTILGLSLVAWFLIIAIVALALGAVVLLSKKRKAQEDYDYPYDEDYDGYDASYGDYPDEDYRVEAGAYGGDHDDYGYSHEDDHEPEPDYPEPVKPVRKAKRPKPKPRKMEGGGAVKPVKKTVKKKTVKKPATTKKVKRPAPPQPEPEDVHEVDAHEPEHEVEPEEPPAMYAPPLEEKELIVECPNCENEMHIKYVAPPVLLVCDKCGMRGEVPEEML